MEVCVTLLNQQYAVKSTIHSTVVMVYLSIRLTHIYGCKANSYTFFRNKDFLSFQSTMEFCKYEAALQMKRLKIDLGQVMDVNCRVTTCHKGYILVTCIMHLAPCSQSVSGSGSRSGSSFKMNNV